MKITLLPKNKAAIWASLLSILFVMLIFFKIRGTIPLSMFLIAALGLGGLAAGLIAAVKKDRSIFTILSILIGLFIVIWIAAEIIYPH